jgi:predicted O-methyltransferase YrrM
MKPMSYAVALAPALEDYLISVSVHEPDVLARLRAETASHPQAQMQISPEQGQFLRFLVKALGIKRSLEVGVFTGYSSLSVALAMPDDGRIVACDVSEEFTSVARRYWKEAGVEKKIDLRLAPAVQTLDGLLADRQAGTFDFAFIDADKGNYQNYFDRAIQLVRKGGVIAIDNVLWSGRVADPSVKDADTVAIRAFNAKLHEDERVFVSMLPLRDGVSLAFKK